VCSRLQRYVIKSMQEMDNKKVEEIKIACI
jgi:hypothetical protein